MKKRVKYFYRGGFTLIEILVAITIVSILSGIVLHSASASLRNARNSQRKSDLRIIENALQQYYSDHGFYPLGNGPGGLGRLEITFEQVNQAPLTACSGNPNVCNSSRVYLRKIPNDPLSSCAPAGRCFYPMYGSHDLHYCYESYASIAAKNSNEANFITCDNTATKCNFYVLAAQLEDSAPSVYTNMGCNDGGHNFNYMLTPLSGK
jgi:prepilin-type N-terminal cleavage/methylation domain-containing protein